MYRDVILDATLAVLAAAGIGPWIEAGRTLTQRTADRGEFPPADLDTLATVIPNDVHRTRQPITRKLSLALIDNVIPPALRGGRPQPRPAKGPAS